MLVYGLSCHRGILFNDTQAMQCDEGYCYMCEVCTSKTIKEFYDIPGFT